MSLEDDVNKTENSPRAVLLRALEEVDKGDVTDVIVITEQETGTGWQTSQPISFATSVGMAVLCQDGLRQQARAASQEAEEDDV